jgi:uncharacterized protein
LSEREINEILQRYRVIAVVGLSGDRSKPSYEVAAYMQSRGYRIVPVNPNVGQVLGERSYKSLLEIPAETQRQIEIVDVFRRVQDVLPVVEQTVKLKAVNEKPLVVWMQTGIVAEAAAVVARKAGLVVVMDRCIMVEHKRRFNRSA